MSTTIEVARTIRFEREFEMRVSRIKLVESFGARPPSRVRFYDAQSVHRKITEAVYGQDPVIVEVVLGAVDTIRTGHANIADTHAAIDSEV
jgi:hypothetical protein